MILPAYSTMLVPPELTGTDQFSSKFSSESAIKQVAVSPGMTEPQEHIFMHFGETSEDHFIFFKSALKVRFSLAKIDVRKLRQGDDHFAVKKRDHVTNRDLSFARPKF